MQAAERRKSPGRRKSDGQPASAHGGLLSPGFTDKTIAALTLSRTGGEALHSDVTVDQWIQKKLKLSRTHSVFIPLADVEHWHFEAATGNIAHDSGRFFTVTGVQARHRSKQGDLVWDQPIIDQPEIGILGILGFIALTLLGLTT